MKKAQVMTALVAIGATAFAWFAAIKDVLSPFMLPSVAYIAISLIAATCTVWVAKLTAQQG